MSDKGLGRRSWTWAQGGPLLAAGLAVAGVVLTAAVTGQQPQGRRVLILAGVLAAGILIVGVARAVCGTAAVHRRLVRARQEWAAGRHWTYVGDEPAVAPETVGLVLPRGWSPPLPRAGMHGVARGRDARVQTWKLRSAPTSKRQSTHREVVEVRAATVGHRLAALTGQSLEPALITPSWVTSNAGRAGRTGVHVDGDPLILDTWGPAISASVRAHTDLPFTLVVGADRVVVYALDDPRPSTTQARLELAATVAEIVDPTASPPR